jgi:subtilisin family serine protease
MQAMDIRALPQHLAVTIALVLALCLLMLLGVAGHAQADCGPGDFVPDQVIVKLKRGTTVTQINTTYGSTALEQFPGSRDIYLLGLPAGSDVLETVGQLADDPRLLYAEPNFFSQSSEQSPEGGARHRPFGVSSVAPTSREYAAQALGLEGAHNNFSLGEGTTVAVVDTGAQLDHPALEANFEGVKRYDFVEDDKNPSERPANKDADCDGDKDEMVGHGIVDITAPAAKIMPLRVLDTEGYGDVFTIAKAISFASRNGADVINLSLGSPSRSSLLQGVIKGATTNGVLVAAAAGNSNSPVAQYPAAGDGLVASADGLVAVTSVSMYEKKSDFANYGLWVDIAAPGEGIRSAFPVSVYANWSGTSMATPFVSGQAALIHAVYGSLKPADVEGKIRCSARSLLATDPVYAALLGAGHADVDDSLAAGDCS